ncbi:MAG: SDR family oxidoreductase [Pseudomonadota bacterium]
MARPTVVITGGSRGIGRATALAAARAGWNVAIGYRGNEAAAQATLEEIRRTGAEAVAVAGSVIEERDVAALFDHAEAALGPVSAVVVNAGIVGPSLPLAQMDVTRLRGMVETNLLGALLTAREAARRLPRSGGGSVIFVSSSAARLGSANEYVDYAATKGALDTLTIGLSRELAPEVRVNAVRPGLIDTDIHASGGQPDRAARLGAGTPLGRAGTAEEVAAAILWLLGPEASYVTGSILDIAGGR